MIDWKGNRGTTVEEVGGQRGVGRKGREHRRLFQGRHFGGKREESDQRGERGGKVIGRKKVIKGVGK